MSHNLSKTAQTEINGLTSRHSYQAGGLCDGDPGHVKGPQMSHQLVKNNTDRMNQLVREMFHIGWRSV